MKNKCRPTQFQNPRSSCTSVVSSFSLWTHFLLCPHRCRFQSYWEDNDCCLWGVLVSVDQTRCDHRASRSHHPGLEPQISQVIKSSSQLMLPWFPQQGKIIGGIWLLPSSPLHIQALVWDHSTDRFVPRYNSAPHSHALAIDADTSIISTAI